MQRFCRNTLGLLVLVGVCLFGSPPKAHADLKPTLISVTANGDGTFRYTYRMTISEDVFNGPDVVRYGDYFTIYDFAGFTGVAAGPNSNWVFSSANFGLTPPEVNPADDPGIPNLTFTYVGQADLYGPQVLGLFYADSIYNGRALDSFAASTHRDDPDLGIIVIQSHTLTNVSVPSPRETPEPTSLALVGFGLPLLGAARVWRRKRTA